MSQYVYDIINQAGKQCSALGLMKFGAYTVVCDDHPYAYYLAASFARTVMPEDPASVNIIYEDSGRDEFYEKFLDENFSEKINRYDTLKEHAKNFKAPTGGSGTESCGQLIVFFTNLRQEKCTADGYADRRCALLKEYLEYASECENAVFIHAVYMPPIDALPDGVSGISEREYEVVYRDAPENSTPHTLLRLEEVCRGYAERIRINAIRLDTMFGPHIADDCDVTIQKYVAEIIDSGTLTVEADTRQRYYSASYIKDALIKTIIVAAAEVNGNIYNISSWHFPLFELVYDLYTVFTHLKIDLKVTGESGGDIEYHLLNPRKIKFIAPGKLGRAMTTSLRKAVHTTALSAMKDYEHYVTEKVNVYYGKIDRIRNLELELILQVDEICKKHNIKYFLAGGSMLGALRHGGFIPWDDDMDIGMLPSEYKKFVKVCPKELTSNYFYQTTDLEPESLYIHDKIRIENTVFSTSYANQFKMHNGVYIDIFVYYKTSDDPKKQQRHIRQIEIMRRILGMRWVNKPRRNLHYYKSLVLLPIMRLFPTTFFRHLYIRLLEKYEKKDTHYLIDGSGFNLSNVGAFPREWFDEITYRDFCGHSLPVLARYDDYLKHWYGEKYMELLPFSSRNSVHDVIRIDLGDKLFEETANGNFHQMDFRGELYDKMQGE